MKSRQCYSEPDDAAALRPLIGRNPLARLATSLRKANRTAAASSRAAALRAASRIIVVGSSSSTETGQHLVYYFNNPAPTYTCLYE
ncbi:hypothetical protein TYRP_019105 [Tyrophagus putrescentiae]|nr:hypothetical protein TYRP_019105 [Tyrophagus putrescentiae]